MLDDQDEGTRAGVWVTLSLITLLLFGLVGGLALRQMNKQRAPASAPVEVVVEEVLIEGPIAGELAGTVYFDVGVAELPAGAEVELGKVKAALDAAPNRKLVLSGFHDATGDAAKNAELAKQRAKSVRDAMKIAGVDGARIGLRKPESTTGDGTEQQARRVELRLVD